MSETARDRPTFGAHRAWLLGFCVLVLLAVAFVFANPIRDGDIWWQMAYGRHLLAERTLIPDHSLFSWTATDAGEIYCAWVAQILLYLCYRAGGVTILLAIRYACVLVFLLVLWSQARRTGILRHPLTGFICLLGAAMSYGAGFVKPEIFSYVLMTLTTAVWIRVKLAPQSWRLLYAFPLLMLLWVNSHGGFIFGIMFLGIMFLGELLNALYAPAAALSRRVRQHLFVAVVLSVVTVFLTPYGWSYPRQLLTGLASEPMAAHMRAVGAYAWALAPEVQRFHLAVSLVGAAVVLGALTAAGGRRRFNWAVILVNLGFACLYVAYRRATYFLAPVFCLSALYLLADRSTWLWPRRAGRARLLGAGVLLVGVLFCGRIVWASVAEPADYQWLGFGISYQNPVEEAEFIARTLGGGRLGNDYDAGGYLLWRLWPDVKVMIDPRYFPYRSWFAEYCAFAAGATGQAFIEKYPCDLWFVGHYHQAMANTFINAAEWVPLFYGVSGAVFGPRARRAERALPERGAGLGAIRNLEQAVVTLGFALRIGDLAGARTVLTGMRGRFGLPSQRPTVAAAAAMIDGVEAFQKREYAIAAEAFRTAREAGVFGPDPLLVQCYQHLAGEHWRAGRDAATAAAIAQARALQPDNLLTLYNAGVVAWHSSRGGEGSPEPARHVETAERPWAPDLERFLERGSGHAGVPKQAIPIARAILAGSYGRRPPLLVPRAPAAK